MLYTTEKQLKIFPQLLPYDLYLARWSVPEARALARNPRIWEYGEGKAGDIPHAILLRGYFASLPDSGGDFLRRGTSGIDARPIEKSPVIFSRMCRYTV